MFNHNLPITKDPGLGGLHINGLPECMGNLAAPRQEHFRDHWMPPIWEGMNQYKIYKSMAIFKGICRKITICMNFGLETKWPLWHFCDFVLLPGGNGDYEITNYRKILCNLPGDLRVRVTRRSLNIHFFIAFPSIPQFFKCNAWSCGNQLLFGPPICSCLSVSRWFFKISPTFWNSLAFTMFERSHPFQTVILSPIRSFWRVSSKYEWLWCVFVDLAWSNTIHEP